MDEIVNYKLFAPNQFWETDWKHYIVQCNGCGDDDTVKFSKCLGLSMDYILCVNVRPACAIHDWQYTSPKKLGIKPSEEHRLQCDEILYTNLIRIVKAEGEHLKSWKITNWARLKICGTYYFLVRKCGSKAYWEANKTEGPLLTNLEESFSSIEEKQWFS